MYRKNPIKATSSNITLLTDSASTARNVTVTEKTQLTRSFTPGMG